MLVEPAELTGLGAVLNRAPIDKSILMSIELGSFGINFAIKNHVSKMNMQHVDIRSAQIVSSDILGLPLLTKNFSRMTYVKPSWWPKDPSSKGFIVFDEFERAAEEVSNVIYNLAASRKLHGDSLPDGWKIILLFRSDRPFVPTQEQSHYFYCVEFKKS